MQLISNATDLPVEMVSTVFHHLPLHAKLLARTVCKQWRHLVDSDPTLWQAFAARECVDQLSQQIAFSNARSKHHPITCISLGDSLSPYPIAAFQVLQASNLSLCLESITLGTSEALFQQLWDIHARRLKHADITIHHEAVASDFPARSIEDLLVKAPVLKTLRFQNTPIMYWAFGDPRIVPVGRVTRQTGQFRLHELELDGLRFDRQQTTNASDSYPELSSLRLRNCVAYRILSSINNSTILRSLVIQRNRNYSTGANVGYALDQPLNFPNLTIIELETIGLDDIFTKNPHFPCLEILRVTDNPVIAGQLERFSAGSPMLRVLELVDTATSGIEREDISGVLKSWSHLEIVTMRNTTFNICRIIQALRKHNTRLQQLTLHHHDKAAIPIGYEVLHLVKQRPNLQTLYVGKVLRSDRSYMDEIKTLVADCHVEMVLKKKDKKEEVEERPLDAELLMQQLMDGVLD